MDYHTETRLSWLLGKKKKKERKFVHKHAEVKCFQIAASSSLLSHSCHFNAVTSLLRFELQSLLRDVENKLHEFQRVAKARVQ